MNDNNVLFITLDSCRYDTFFACHAANSIPCISRIGPLHKALSPSYFTYGSHAAFWMGFTPGVVGSVRPWLNPKAGKLFRMSFSGFAANHKQGEFTLEGPNIIEGFKRLGYATIGTGAVDWFNSDTETGAVLAKPFDHFYFSGNTWSLKSQLQWINDKLAQIPVETPRFVFLNIGETHVPYWHDGASWGKWPSPCVPFGGDKCNAYESARRQKACLQWVDRQLGPLLYSFSEGTILICADHGDCWGEDGLWEHGISHNCTLTVPLILRVRGQKIGDSRTSPSRFRSVFLRLKRWLRALFST